MQKTLRFITESDSLRADADGWVAEDGDLINIDKPIGLSPEYKGFICYKTPMHAIADGWKLLAIPVKHIQYGFYEWWFVKD